MLSRSERLVAVTRFGLGPSDADLAEAASDPRGYVLAQVDPSTPTPAALRDLKPLSVLRDEHLALRAELDEARKAKRAARNGRGDAETAEEAALREEARKAMQRHARETFQAEAAARVRVGLETETPFVERLVSFWQNHFAISPTGVQGRLVTGNYEREAIRPFVFGRFEDMAKAAILHPAMLHYLDNVQSVGPNSRQGRRRDGDINENLAREALELHTLGAGGGYGQDDVRSLALVLTGWQGGLVGNAERALDFLPARHEPGPKTVLGKRYRDDGAAQALAVIGDLARHPSTARHVTGKLARHFTSDRPPAGLAERLEATFLDTDGDLLEVTQALVTADGAWTAPPAKFVPPSDFIVSAMRAFSVGLDMRAFNAGIRVLGFRLWEPKAPTGWPDADDAWLGGDHLLERLDWATLFARRDATPPDDPVGFAADLLGPDFDPDLEVAIGRAESTEQALALLLMSAQWQRR